MADRASASMIIGGTITHALIPELIKQIEIDGGRADWEGAAVEADCIMPGHVLEIFAYELCGGIFENVECFCEENRISFVRSSASCAGAFGPERVVFTGLEPPKHFDLGEAEEVVLTRRDIQELGSLEAIGAFFQSADFTPPPIEIRDDIRPPAEVHHG